MLTLINDCIFFFHVHLFGQDSLSFSATFSRPVEWHEPLAIGQDGRAFRAEVALKAWPWLCHLFHGQEGRAFRAEVALKAWSWLCHLFHGQEGRAFRAEMALKAWPWPGLPSFPRPHFPGKPGKKAGKPGQARLFQAYRAFDRAPDARGTVNRMNNDCIYSYIRIYCSYIVNVQVRIVCKNVGF